jgi:hypothetical protein
MNMDTRKLFTAGKLYATPGARNALQRGGDDVHVLLLRHLCLDPGELSPEDVRANDRAVRDGSRIFSAYKLSDGTKVWIITEAGDSPVREVTTVLLPEEY